MADLESPGTLGPEKAEIKGSVWIAHHIPNPLYIPSHLAEFYKLGLRLDNSYDNDFKKFDLVSWQEFNGVPSKHWSELALLFEITQDPALVSDSVGLFHYRRFLAPCITNTNVKRVYIENAEYIHYLEAAKRQFLESRNELFIPRAIRVPSVIQQFTKFHKAQRKVLLDSCEEVFSELENLFGPIIGKPLESNRLTAWNLFYGPKSFALLFSRIVRNSVSKSQFTAPQVPDNDYQIRWAGFVGERIFSIICDQLEKKKIYPIRRVPIATTARATASDKLVSLLELLDWK